MRLVADAPKARRKLPGRADADRLGQRVVPLFPAHGAEVADVSNVVVGEDERPGRGNTVARNDDGLSRVGRVRVDVVIGLRARDDERTNPIRLKPDTVPRGSQGDRLPVLSSETVATVASGVVWRRDDGECVPKAEGGADRVRCDGLQRPSGWTEQRRAGGQKNLSDGALRRDEVADGLDLREVVRRAVGRGVGHRAVDDRAHARRRVHAADKGVGLAVESGLGREGGTLTRDRHRLVSPHRAAHGLIHGAARVDEQKLRRTDGRFVDVVPAAADRNRLATKQSDRRGHEHVYGRVHARLRKRVRRERRSARRAAADRDDRRVVRRVIGDRAADDIQDRSRRLDDAAELDLIVLRQQLG